MYKTEDFTHLSFGVPENELLFTCFSAGEGLMVLIAQVHCDTIQPVRSLHSLGVCRLKISD